MKRTRLSWLLWWRRQPRCPLCRTLVVQPGFCCDAHEHEWQQRMIW